MMRLPHLCPPTMSWPMPRARKANFSGCGRYWSNCPFKESEVIANQLTIHEAHELLKNRNLSSVELTTAYLKRIRNSEPKVRALVTVTDELALKQAQKAD